MLCFLRPKKIYQGFSLAQESAARAISAPRLQGIGIGRHTAVRSGQFFGAVLLAGGLLLLNVWLDDGIRLLAAFSATSALAYIVLAMQSRTGALSLLNLLASPILFVTASLGMYAATEWLILSFILHGCASAVQLSAVDKGVRSGLFCWSVFSSAVAVFLGYSEFMGWQQF